MRGKPKPFNQTRAKPRLRPLNNAPLNNITLRQPGQLIIPQKIGAVTPPAPTTTVTVGQSGTIYGFADGVAGSVDPTTWRGETLTDLRGNTADSVCMVAFSGAAQPAGATIRVDYGTGVALLPWTGTNYQGTDAGFATALQTAFPGTLVVTLGDG